MHNKDINLEDRSKEKTKEFFQLNLKIVHRTCGKCFKIDGKLI